MRKVVGAMVLVSGLLLASGCTTATPNVAFIVGGEAVSNSEVEDLVVACAQAFKQEPREVSSQVLSFVLEGRIAAHILTDKGIKYSNAEREEFLRQSTLGNTLLRNPTCQQVGYGVADYALLIDQLSMEDFIAAQQQVEVVLNPRYGYWDPTAATVIGNGSLSETANGS
ncbi:MAG: hypothetical protein LBC29_00210 [Propionibacteriaceae bacterium]|nr:hypothetical protein [Propionibacteriaceae bacterium]